MPSNKTDFINDRNVIIYEHSVVDEKIFASIANHLANPHNPQAKQEMDVKLASLIKEVEDKYDKPDLKEQIRLIYLFLMEGTRGAVIGTLREPRQEQKIKEAFGNHAWTSDFPKVKVLGVEELGEILTRIEAKPNFNLKHQDFLLGENGRWGYDTPKITSAFIQLARRKYERQEMFIRLDSDVEPHGQGINPVKGPDYDRLFNHFVNSYSIRVSFFGAPSCLCQYGNDLMTGKLFCTDKADENAPCNTPCRLNTIHTKFFY